MTLTTLQQRIEALDCPYPGIVPFAEGFAVAKEFILKFVRDEIEKSTPTREEPERIVVQGRDCMFERLGKYNLEWYIEDVAGEHYLRHDGLWGECSPKWFPTEADARAFARECSKK